MFDKVLSLKSLLRMSLVNYIYELASSDKSKFNHNLGKYRSHTHIAQTISQIENFVELCELSPGAHWFLTNLYASIPIIAAKIN